MEIIHAKNGFFEKYKDDLFEAVIKVDGDPSKEEMSESLAPVFKRMPIRLFKQALAFVEHAHKTQQSEGMVAFRYKEGIWSLVIPPQWNTGGNVHYHFEPVEEFGSVVGDMHSHPKMGSFHSGTDHHDEGKMFGIYLVVSDFRIMNCNPDIVGHVRGKRFKIDPELFFDENDAGGDYAFPEEWKTRLHKPPCTICSPAKPEGAREEPSRSFQHEWPGRHRGGDWSARIREEAQRKGQTPAGSNDGAGRSGGEKEVVDLLNAGKIRETIVKSYEEWQDDDIASRCYLFECDNQGCEKDLQTLLCPLCSKPVHPRNIVDAVATHAERAMKALKMGLSGVLFSGGVWSMLRFLCDNDGCRKEIPYLTCPDCRKPVHPRSLVKAVADVVDTVVVIDPKPKIIIVGGETKEEPKKEDKKDETKKIEKEGINCPPGCYFVGKHSHEPISHSPQDDYDSYMYGGG